MNTRLNRSLRVTFLGLATNAVLAFGKLAAGTYGHSHALVADGVESLADIFSSLIVWRGLVVSAAPADEDHPYGHGKAEPIAAAVVATMLLLAAVWIAVRSVQEIIRPHASPAPFTLLVLFLVVVIKEGLFRYVFHEAQEVDSLAVRSDAWHHRSDAITSIAAAFGITIALLGGPAYAMADDVAAIVAAGIIAWNGWRLLKPAMDELMDATPDLSLNKEICDIARSSPGVDDVEKCRVRKVGYHYFVDLHIEVDPKMTVEDGHQAAHRVKDLIRTRLPMVYDVLIHVEPSRNSPSRGPGK